MAVIFYSLFLYFLCTSYEALHEPQNIYFRFSFCNHTLLSDTSLVLSLFSIKLAPAFRYVHCKSLVLHIYTVVYSKFFFFRIFSSCKVLRMLKIGCLSKITISQVCFKVFSGNFLLNSGERHVVVVSFTHIHSGLQEVLIFQKFQ